jgi:lysophospholipase L1-like esterase
MTNLSIGGATASDVTRLEVPRVAVTSPDVILLCVGANDVVRFHSRAAFARDYGALVHALRAAAPRAKLVIFNIPDVAVSPIFDARARAAYSALARDDNREIEQAARESGAAVVDFYGFTGVQGANTAHFLSDDQFHPSDEGYAELARKSWPAVEREMGTALRGRTYTPRANP